MSRTIPVDTGCKLNVHKTFVLCTFNLRPVSTGIAGDVLRIKRWHGQNCEKLIQNEKNEYAFERPLNYARKRV